MIQLCVRDENIFLNSERACVTLASMSASEKQQFPFETTNVFLNALQWIVGWVVRLLAVLMVVVIFWSLGDLFYSMYLVYKEHTFRSMDLELFFSIFGGVLLVLIGVEIFLNVILYLRDDVDHLKLVLATALMAVARKVIIIDYTKLSALHLFGIGALTLALGLTYWLVRERGSTTRGLSYHQSR